MYILLSIYFNASQERSVAASAVSRFARSHLARCRSLKVACGMRCAYDCMRTFCYWLGGIAAGSTLGATWCCGHGAGPSAASAPSGSSGSGTADRGAATVSFKRFQEII